MYKFFASFLFVIIIGSSVTAQQKFIKAASSSAFGISMKTFATADGGFVVFSLDSFKLSKFSGCGINEWSKKININNSIAGLSDIIQMVNGDFLLLTRIQLNTNNTGALVTRIDATGNIIWSISYQYPVYDFFPYTISEDQNGDAILFCNLENTGNNNYFNLIIKIEAAGNVLWCKTYDQGGIWGGAIVTSDNGILFRTGNRFIKTDSIGNVQWHSLISGMGYNYFQPVEVSDGFIFDGYISGPQLITFGKIDKSGNLLWGGRKTSDLIGNPPKFRKRSNGNIVGVFQEKGSTIIEFDKDLNVISKNSIKPGTTLIGRDICFVNGVTPILAGITNGTPSLFIAKMDGNYLTDCNVSGNAVNYTLDALIQSFAPTNVVSQPLNIVVRTYTVDTFSMQMNNLCFVQKTLDLGGDTSICESTTLALQNHTSDIFEHYQWSTGDTTPTITVNQSGKYWLLATYNCDEYKVADTVEVTVTPDIAINLGADLKICEDSSEIILAPSCIDCNYLWSTGNTLPAIEITQAGTYWLSIDNGIGCITSDTIEAAIVKCNCNLYLPNAFTPNNDDVNELFKPVYDCDFSDYNLQIFNRWGQLIYTTKNKDDGWNGLFNNEIVPQGIYLYVLNYKPNIKTQVKNSIVKSGTVAVIY